MFLTFLKIGYRNLLQNWTMSLISVVGLALGLTATLLITLYVAHEYSYDRFHQRGDRIVKVSLSHTDGESSYTIPWMSFSFGEALKNACPEVADFARIRNESSGGKLVQSDNQHKFFESNFRFADAGFVRMFDFPFIQGNPTTALTRPATVLLTERTARKYFGNASPLGKTIKFDKKYTFEVVGVLRDLPTNSSLQFDFLAHIDASRAIDHANYSSSLSEKETKAQMNIVGASGAYYTYLLLHPGASVDKVAAKIPTILTPKERLKDSKDAFQLYPLFDLHLTVDALGVRSRTLLFSGIAFFVLVLALVNYINLSTARSTKRAKEVAVRKVAGAPRQLLIAQFYIESALQVTLAFGLSLLLFSSLQPLFSQIVHFQTDPSFLLSRFFIVPAGLFFIGCIFLAGSYPALLLSGFSPVANLKVHSASSRTSLIRSGLTVFQFVVSIALIISSILMSKQFDLFLRKDVGIDREQVLTIPLNKEPEMAEHYATIREKVSQIPGVERVSASSLVMYGNYRNGWGVKRLDNPKQVSVSAFNVDQQFIKTMNIGWAIPPAGNASFRSKSQIVLNETAARMLGITKANYRQTLDLDGVQKELAGVVKDFNYMSLEVSIQPMLFFIAPDTTRHDYLYVKLAKNRTNDLAATEATLMRIQQVYDQYKTEYPFEYTFLDDTYQKLYQTYLINGQIVYFFTCLAILIACLGLFGLAAFTAEQRTKEIGVRKVLGASVTSIVALLSRDFLKLVLIAIVLASPIAYYAMHQWLHDFAYKITIEWWVFALAGLLAVGVALLTVSFQSIRAALVNPVKSLRSE